MGKGKGLEGFDGRRFDWETIVLCARWYLCYKICLRELVEMTARRLTAVLVKRWNCITITAVMAR
jgi:transposase-like protein